MFGLMRLRRAIAWTIRIGGALFIADLIADRRDFTILDPDFFIPFSCLSALLVAPIVVARPVPIARAITEACTAPAAILAMALALLNAAAPPGIWAFPSLLLIVESLAAGIALTTCAAFLTRWMLSRVSSRVIVWGFRGAALSALLIWRWCF